VADDLVFENDVEAGKVTTRPRHRKIYTDLRHGSALKEVARAREIQNSLTPYATYVGGKSG
jgi:hypothetical protein